MLGKRKLVAASKASKRARKTVLAVRRVPARRDELKTIDTGLVSFAPLDPTNANFQLLNGVATGTDYTNRIGRKIIVNSMLIRGNFSNVINVTDSDGAILRLMVICDEQPNGAAPIITDILQTAHYLAPANLNNRGRFKILYDKFLTMNSWSHSGGVLATGSPGPKTFKLYKRLTLPVIFNGTGATVGSIQTNSIYLVALCSNTTCNFEFNSRIRFVDS